MSRLILALAIAGFALLNGYGAPAVAQNRDMRDLMNRVDRLQRELSTLQRYIYQNPPAKGKGGRPPPPGAAGVNPEVAAKLEVRMTQFENEIRSLTGLVEETVHAVRQVTTRVEKLVTDVDMRLAALEQGMARMQAQAQPRAGGAAGPKGGKPPATLGYVPKDGSGKGNKGAALPKGTPKQQYDYAISLLKKQNFEGAERALRAFIAAHPKHALTDNAQYWLGETYYVRKNYEQAAFAFADAFKKYPTAPKAADSLLKLGMSLGQLGRKKEACTAYDRLIENFPKMRKNVKVRVNRERRNLKCK